MIPRSMICNERRRRGLDELREGRTESESAAHFEQHFNSEDTSEDVVKVVEYFVAVGLLPHGIFGGQRDAAGADDDHDEEVKVSQVDHKMAEAPDAEGDDSRVMVENVQGTGGGWGDILTGWLAQI